MVPTRDLMVVQPLHEREGGAALRTAERLPRGSPASATRQGVWEGGFLQKRVLDRIEGHAILWALSHPVWQRDCRRGGMVRLNSE